MRQRSRPAGRLRGVVGNVAVLALVAGMSTVVPGVASGESGDGNVTVRVVQEVNANGLVDSTIMEPPLAGVTVRLSDATGHTLTATTSDDGTVTFDVAGSDLTGGKYRVETENPRPDFFYPGFAANGQSPAAAPVTPADLKNANNKKLSTTVEFVDVSDGAPAFVNTSYWFPGYYCQENAAVVTACQPWDAPPQAVSQPTEKTLISAPYRFTADDQKVATKADTGVVYGIAYDRTHQRVFSSAYAKRGSAYGSGGPGGIYVTDLSTATYPVAGTTSLWNTVANAGADNHAMTTNQDYAFFANVGKESLGDIDVTLDDKYLFGVNMFDKSVFVYDLNSNSLVGTYAIPNPGCGADWRPMGTGVGLDTSYVGGVCSGQSAQDRTTMSAHVYKFDPATGTFGTQVLDQPLDYGRGRGYNGTVCTGSLPNDLTTGAWFSWIDNFPNGPNEQRPAGCAVGWISYPEPMLGDIIEETNGDLIISFRDRFGDQMGFNATIQLANGNYIQGGEPGSGGDVLRGCKLTNGSFVLDPNLTAGDALAPSALCTNNNVAGTDSGSEPKTYREFYVGDYRTGFHEEAFYGGMALSRVEPNVDGTGFDSTGAVWTQGIGAIGRDGKLPQGNLGVQTDDGTVDNFGKGSGMADLEVLCDEAPIQIGNRVWLDSDSDGEQDPGEDAVAGATVHLYDEQGNLVGTTTTSANGDYYFDAKNVTGGLAKNTKYTIRLDKPEDYQVGGPLYGMTATKANAAGVSDELDSDGVVAGDGFPEAAVTTAGAGQDDHSWDFGFVLPSVSVGDFVWVDTDRDGIQDAGEPGIPGVVVNVTGPDGHSVTNVHGKTVLPQMTDADGKYSFDDLPVLPAGQHYTVTIDQNAAPTKTALAPYIPTTAGAGDDRGKDSSTWTAESGDLTENGDRDPSLDFGFVTPAVSVGDFVWVDSDKDGIQDAGEPGIPGVVLKVTGPDGQPVTDVFGNPVGPQTTNGSGAYSFDNLPALPAGQHYTVTIDQDAASTKTALAPYVPTTAGAGDDRGLDSSTWTATSGDLTHDGDRDPSLDFGFVPGTVSVGDFVWVDTDRDGIQDAGEPGIPGVVLNLTGPDGQPVTDVNGDPVGPQTTDGNGAYSFDNLPVLPAGQHYTVAIDQSADSTKAALAPYIPTTPGAGDDRGKDSSTWTAESGDLTESGDRDPSLDFGFVTPAVSVGDFVWVDTDKDGIQDAGEPGIQGVVLNVTGPDGQPVTDVFGNPVGPQTTDANGAYSFDNLPALPAGEHYTVTIDQDAASTKTALAPYTPTTAGAGDDRGKDSSTWTATSGDLIHNGDRDPSLDFGFVPAKVSVGDYVWVDTDKDGIQDAGEPGIPGVVLNLTGPGGQPVTDVDGNPVGPQTTDADGGYSFDNLPVLPAGQHYTVTIDQNADSTKTALAPYVPTTAGAGDDRGLDSSTWTATSGDLTQNGDRDPTLDFGFVPATVSVGDYVWVDTDKDGIQDAGEPGIPGVVLTISGPDGEPVTDVNGQPVGPQTTDANGKYSFDDLPPLPAGQHYTVTVDQDADSTKAALAPYIPTTPGAGDDRGKDSSTWTATSGDLTENGDSDQSLDFGFVPAKVSVGDYVWVDKNRDGIQDAGESAIPGVVLVLTGPDGQSVTDVDGNPVGPQTTDANGKYSFDNLPVLPAGQHYTVTIDQTAPSTQAALAPYVPTTAGAGDDRGKDSSTWTATSGDLVHDGDRDPSLDFGFVVPKVSVGDFVWVDSNKDGIQDEGEPGIAGVVLTVTGPDGQPVTDVFGNPVGPRTTDANGAYSFDNLPALPAGQHYTVTIDRDADSTKAALAPYTPTTAGAGDDRGKDSSTWTATSGDLTGDGDRDPSLDFGFVPSKVSVGDYVWVDSDKDGIQDEGEPGIQGVVLTVTGPDGKPVTDVDGNPVGPVTTDADGKYSFDNLPVLPTGDHYTVTIDRNADSTKAALAPYTPTTAGAGDDRSLDSSSWTATSGDLTHDGDRDPTLDFGFVPSKVSVSDFVWVDTNKNGIQNAGEPGIPGVVLVLTGPDGKPVTDVDGNPVGPVTTDADGKYSFDNLPVLPAGQHYTVSIDRDASAQALEPYVPTIAGAGSDRGKDSSTWSATSGDLTQDGDSDSTLDFGFVVPEVPTVSVGDFVWVDTNGNGIQESGEPGIPGVVLVLTGPDGQPVTDVNGNVVGPQTTDVNGKYSFDNLPVLPAGKHYTVSIDRDASAHALAPYVPTAGNAGGDRGLDSSTWSATSGDLVNGGDRDATLDFGFVVPSHPLPNTGAPVTKVLTFSTILLLLGSGLVLAGRRRRRTV